MISSEKIKDHYNKTVKNMKGEYIQHRWGDSAIKRCHYKQTELALKHVLKKIDRFESVMEIGCGPAVWSPLFIDAAKELTLVDISVEMLKMARKRLFSSKNIKYVSGDFVNLDFDNNIKHDLIISIRAYEYMSDKMGVVKKCFELLKPNGYLVIVTKNNEWIDHKKEMTKLDIASVENLPVSKTMQMDLIHWGNLENSFNVAGFKEVVTYPVILGSYGRLFNSKVGLILCDFLHKSAYKRPIASWLDFLTESYLTIGKKCIENAR